MSELGEYDDLEEYVGCTFHKIMVSLTCDLVKEIVRPLPWHSKVSQSQHLQKHIRETYDLMYHRFTQAYIEEQIISANHPRAKINLGWVLLKSDAEWVTFCLAHAETFGIDDYVEPRREWYQADIHVRS